MSATAPPAPEARPRAPAGSRPSAAPRLPAGPRMPMPLQTTLWVIRPAELMLDCWRRYGDTFTMRLYFNGDVVVTADPELVRAVFTADPDRLRAGEANATLEPLLGARSVLLLDGPEHLRQRRLMLPAFHGERLQRWAGVIREVTEQEMRRWPTGHPFPLRRSTQAITLEVILRAVFGIAEADRIAVLRDALTSLLDLGSSPSVLLPWLRHDLGSRSPWGRFVRRRSYVDELLLEEIRRRRIAARAELEARGDVLSMLLAARDEDGEPMTDAELRDELITLLLAGHETTATALAWTLDALLRNPGVIARLTAELARGDGAYLDAVIKEGLRLRPVVPAVARRVTAPARLGDRLLPAGCAVAPNIFLVHRNPRAYPDPLVFRPERFLGREVDTYSWIPFGGGIRRCLGASFATLEMRTVIPAVLSGARLRVARARPPRAVRRAVTFVPHDGARVVSAGLNGA